MKNTIEFSLKDEAGELAKLLAALNESGIPYSLKKEGIEILVTISSGY
jgi:hypothetical protein